MCQFPSLDLWQTLRRETRPILLYGMGDGADKLIERLDSLGIPYADVFASDGFVRGQHFHGRPVLTLSQAEEKYGEFVILLAFATKLPQVIDTVLALAERHPLYIPDMPILQDAFFDLEYVRAHREELASAYALFADRQSRDLFASSVAGKLYGLPHDLLAHTSTLREVMETLPLSTFRTAVDLGAYTGDTARTLIEMAPSVTRIVAVEPDRRSYAKLKAFGESLTEVELLPIHAAIGAESGEVSLFAKGSRSSTVGEGHTGARTVSVPAVTVDQLCEQMPVSYLKYDVEGAEMEALRGSFETVRRDRPAILLSLYHRPSDLFALPLYLAELCPRYHFYLRRVRCLPVWELDLLAVPQERDVL